MKVNFDEIYYEKNIKNYELGQYLSEKYKDAKWILIENHNNIEELRTRPNSDFVKMKKFLIIGTRKTHKYVENAKISDYLVPFTSSGCSAMCLYCYLVCNYNKCSYMRVFVNREEMMSKLIKTSMKSEKELTFEIGSNSDLILENVITNNLPYTIETFAKSEKGFLTFPTKFDMVENLLDLNHKGRTIIRMSVNPNEVIKKIEIGTSGLLDRIKALNLLCDAGYKVGLLIAPVVLVENWKEKYLELLDILSDNLSLKVKKSMFIEVIFMTYSFVHRAINKEAFPGTVDLYNKELMTGRGRGKYWYKQAVREDGDKFFREEINKRFPETEIVYIV